MTSTRCVVQIAHMKACGQLDKTHNRRRDDFSAYVEASVRFTLLMKGGAAGAAPGK
jgi:hypothetical protein